MLEAHKYTMSISLNVLTHLGLNLYSNVPAVLSEVVANCWDADAQEVQITIDPTDGNIVVQDDGHGMDGQDINGKYLYVGYKRREVKGEEITLKFYRPVMGRKGIGKLSLFSIANTVEVHSVRNSGKYGFVIRAAKIKEAIEAQQVARMKGDTPADYHPEEVSPSAIHITNGTRIELRDMKKGIAQTEVGLRKRLARRFSVIGSKHHFTIFVNGKELTIENRDYFHKIQYLWTFADDKDSEVHRYFALCKNLDKDKHNIVSGELPEYPGVVVRGWIGTARESGALKGQPGEEGSLNKIVIMVRGKLAQEDILEELGETGVFTKYLIGEIHADFLDVDDMEDSATSSRQRIIETDPRYRSLRTLVHARVREVGKVWENWRNEAGTDRAAEIPAVKEWYAQLPKEYRPAAQRLFGKINQLPIEDERDRRIIIKNAIVAFESLRYKQGLQKLDDLRPEDLEAVTKTFQDLDDIEVTLYGQIVQERVKVIEALLEKVDANVREKVIQKHVFDHLWLLDGSWERATATEIMEKRVATEFGKIDAGLTEEEREARVDIKYRTTSGKHVIVELKKADRVLSTTELQAQVMKYHSALRKILEAIGRARDPMEFVCIVGRDLRDWDSPEGRDRSAASLKAYDARVVKYDELIQRVQESYKDFLGKQAVASRLARLIREVEEWAPES